MSVLLKKIYANREWIFLCGVLFLAYCLRILGIKAGLPYAWNNDEPFVIHTALNILKTGDYNPHFFNYPTLVIYCQTVNAIFCYFYAVGHHLLTSLDEIATFADKGQWLAISHPVFYEWGRRLTVVFATLSIGAVYLICSRFYSSLMAAVLASLFLACNLAHLSLSIWTTVDVPTAFFILAAAFASIMIMLEGGRNFYIIAGLLAGMSVASKYNAVPVVFLPLIAHALSGKKSRFFSVDICWGMAAIPAGFLLGCPYALGDLPGFLKGATEILSRYNSSDEKTFFQQLLFYYQGFCQDKWAIGGGGGVGTFLLYSAAAGMVSGFLVNWRLQLLLVAYPLLFVAYMSTVQLNYMRNMIAVNAFLCIFAGIFYAQVLEALSGRMKKLNVRTAYRNVLQLCAAGLLLGPTMYKAEQWADETYHARDTRSAAVSWLEKNVSRHQKIAFARELKWYEPDLARFGSERLLVGQIEKEPIWYWNEGIDYVIIGTQFMDSTNDRNTDVQRYNNSFAHTTIVRSLSGNAFNLHEWSSSPALAVIRVDENFCAVRTWKKGSDVFEFDLSEFKGKKQQGQDENAAREIATPLSSPKIAFEQGAYQVEIAAGDGGADGMLQLDLIRWADTVQKQRDPGGQWRIGGPQELKSSVFTCAKGEVLSLNISWLNREGMPETGSSRQLKIKRVRVRKVE